MMNPPRIRIWGPPNKPNKIPKPITPKSTRVIHKVCQISLVRTASAVLWRGRTLDHRVINTKAQKTSPFWDHPRMIPKRWCLLCFGIDHPVVQGSSAPQDCACCPHKRYLAHLVDHPGWFRGNWLWYFIGFIWWTSDANPGRIHHEGELFLVTSPWCISVIQVLPASGHTGWRVMSKCEPFG